MLMISLPQILGQIEKSAIGMWTTQGTTFLLGVSWYFFVANCSPAILLQLLMLVLSPCFQYVQTLTPLE